MKLTSQEFVPSPERKKVSQFNVGEVGKKKLSYQNGYRFPSLPPPVEN
jgi:hypothetical protein